jgi:HK97 family phage portal protein
MLLRGDGLAYIVRESPGSPVVKGFLPLRREQVVIMRMPPPDPRTPPRLTYYVTTPEGSFGCEQEDMLHFPGFEFNGVTALSVIQWGARNSIGVAIRADEFSGKFFSQGAQPQIAVLTPKMMGPDQQERFKQAWADKYQGQGPNGIPLILTEGLTVKELSVTPVDAQLMETRKWQVSDIARAFGVPPHMIGETTNATSFGTGIEQMGQAFVDYTLGPHLERIEDELNRKLYPRAPYYVEFDAIGLTRADSAGRAAYFKAAIGGTQNPAWMTPNEVREMESLPPLPGADELATTSIPATPPEQLQ